MKHNFLFTGAVAAIVGLTVGCEWTGTSSEESWNDAYSWVNFSGTYRLYNTVDATPGSSGTTSTSTKTAEVSNENHGNTTATDTYSGTLRRLPVVEGSVSLNIGGTVFTDQGGGVLSGGQGGTVNYVTGYWSARLAGLPLVGLAIRASYSYSYEGTDTTPGTPATPGSTITYFTINQQGNLLTFTDNQGVVYSGRVTGANVPSESRTAGNVRLNFEVTAANGAKIVGTLSGDWSGGTSGTLSNRSLLGTYSRGGNHVDLQGASGSISITPLAVTSN